MRFCLFRFAPKHLHLSADKEEEGNAKSANKEEKVTAKSADTEGEEIGW